MRMKTLLRYSLILLFTGIIVGLVYGYQIYQKSRPTEESAYRLIQTKLPEYFKSPSSVKFPPFEAVSFTRISRLGDPWKYRYKVNGYLEAKNPFGVEIRRRYNCNIAYSKNLHGWILLDVDFPDN